MIKMQDCGCNRKINDIKSNIFGIHTLEFTFQIDGDSFNFLRIFLLHAKCRTWTTEVESGIIQQSDIFLAKGIQVILKCFSYSEQEFPYFALVFVVNPRILTGDRTYTGIYDCSPT